MNPSHPWPKPPLALLTLPLMVLPKPAWQRPLAKLLQWALAKPVAEGDFDFLEGQPVAIEVSDLQLSLVVHLNNGLIQIESDEGQAVTRLKGGSQPLLRMISRFDDADTLFFQRDLVMSGNTEIGLALKNALDALEHQQLPLPLSQLLAAIQAIGRRWWPKRGA